MRAPLRLVAVLVSLLLANGCAQNPQRRAADLIENLRNPDAAAVDRAVRQLVEMGEPAVPALVLALKDPEARVRNAAASALWGLGPKAHDAVPTLAEALADNDDGVRLGVVMALESIGRDSAAAVPALARAVRDRDGNVRLWAAKALAKIGPPARAALPALTDAARYDSTRTAAEDAIRAIKGP